MQRHSPSVLCSSAACAALPAARLRRSTPAIPADVDLAQLDRWQARGRLGVVGPGERRLRLVRMAATRRSHRRADSRSGRHRQRAPAVARRAPRTRSCNWRPATAASSNPTRLERTRSAARRARCRPAVCATGCSGLPRRASITGSEPTARRRRDAGAGRLAHRLSALFDEPGARVPVKTEREQRRRARAHRRRSLAARPMTPRRALRLAGAGEAQSLSAHRRPSCRRLSPAADRRCSSSICATSCAFTSGRRE